MDEAPSTGETGCVYFSLAGDELLIHHVASCNGKRIRCVASGHNAVFALCEEEAITIHSLQHDNGHDIQQFVGIAHGSKYAVGRTFDGELYAWGSNDNGQLGAGASVADTSSPTRLPLKFAAEKVAASSTHGAAIDAEGNLYAWGANFQGQLALYQTEKIAASDIEKQITLLPRFVPFSRTYPICSVACGEGFTLVTTQQGAVWGWGTSDCGQLGVSRNSNVALPRMILERDPNDGSAMQTAVCGWAHVLCLSSSGHVYSWGLNSHGQLGRATAGTSSAEPGAVLVEKDLSCQKLFASGCISAMITTSGRLFTWGLNKGCKLLHDGTQRVLVEPTPVAAFASVDVADLCFSEFGTAVLVCSKVYSVSPTLAPWNQTAAVELQGGGLYEDDNTVVRFTYETAQRPGRAALARFQAGENFVGKLLCAPPMLTQPGVYKAEVALDGMTFLHAGWIQFYQPVQLTCCAPAVVDLSSAPQDSIINLLFQCDQPIDSTVSDADIKVKLHSEGGPVIVLDTTRVEEEYVESSRPARRRRSSTSSARSRTRSGSACSRTVQGDIREVALEGDERSMSSRARVASDAYSPRPVPTNLRCALSLQRDDVQLQLPFVAQMSLSLNAGIDWSAAPRQRVIIHDIQFDNKPAIWGSRNVSRSVQLTGKGFTPTGLSARFRWAAAAAPRAGWDEEEGTKQMTTEVMNNEEQHEKWQRHQELPVKVQSATCLSLDLDPARFAFPDDAALMDTAPLQGIVDLLLNDMVLQRPELPLQVIWYEERELSSPATMVCASGGGSLRIQFPPLQYACETMCVHLKIAALDWETVIAAETVEMTQSTNNNNNNNDNNNNNNNNNAAAAEGVDANTPQSNPRAIATPSYEAVCTLPELPEELATLPDDQRVVEVRLLPDGSTPTESALLLPIYQLPVIQQVQPATAKAGATITVALEYAVDCPHAAVRLRASDHSNVVVPATVKAADSCVVFVLPAADVLATVAPKGKQVFVDVSLDGQVFATSLESKVTIK